MKITDNIIRKIMNWSRGGKQNVHKRAIRTDGAAALEGDKTCRDVMHAHVQFHARNFVIPADLGQAIERYLDTDWADGRDPSKIGALNAVSYIGERVAAIYAARRAEILDGKETK